MNIRKNDLVTGKADLELVGKYRLPVYQGVTDQPPENDEIDTIIFDISRGSGMIQVRNLLPLEKVYQQSHNPGSIGTTWHEHHKLLAAFIQMHNPKKIVEVGGGHGILSEYYTDLEPESDWTIIDPLTKLPETAKAKVINQFFDENTKIDPDVDAIVHSHFLEHVYDPTAFFAALANVAPGTWTIFSVPALQKHLELKYITALSFEHVYLCAEEYIEYWLNKSGFQLVRKQWYNDDHSIFYAAVKTVQPLPEVAVPSSYRQNKQCFKDFMNHYYYSTRHINEVIEAANQNVYLFGGHVSSQFLILQGLDQKHIKGLIDNDARKHGKRLYGTDLLVYSPKILQGQQEPIVILKSGAYSKEVKQDILDNVNPTTKFLE